MNDEPLTFLAIPGAPIACDMSGATDTADERIHEYGRLFGHALVDRNRREDAVEFKFAAKAGVHEWVADLAAREARCCPMLTYRVSNDGQHVRYEIILGAEHSSNPELQASLDEIYALPERHTDGARGFYDRLAPHGVSRADFEVPGSQAHARSAVKERTQAPGFFSRLKSACGC